MKETKVFHNLYEFIFFFVFVFAIPLASVVAQLALSDKTMYITFFITNIGLAFNYLGFLFGKPCLRLWVEALILGVFLAINAFVSFTKLFIMLSQKSVEYHWDDVIFVVLFILPPMFCYSYEGILLGKEEYKKRKAEENREIMQEGSQNVMGETSLSKGGSDV